MGLTIIEKIIKSAIDDVRITIFLLVLMIIAIYFFNGLENVANPEVKNQLKETKHTIYSTFEMALGIMGAAGVIAIPLLLIRFFTKDGHRL